MGQFIIIGSLFRNKYLYILLQLNRMQGNVNLTRQCIEDILLVTDEQP